MVSVDIPRIYPLSMVGGVGAELGLLRTGCGLAAARVSRSAYPAAMSPFGSSDWVVASPAACALARATFGPTAAVRYIDVTAGRAPGRRYFVHVADEQEPIATRLYTRLQLERLELGGADADLEAARELLDEAVRTRRAEGPLEGSAWETP